jgi:hypothetical protein
MFTWPLSLFHVLPFIFLLSTFAIFGAHPQLCTWIPFWLCTRQTALKIINWDFRPNGNMLFCWGPGLFNLETFSRDTFSRTGSCWACELNLRSHKTSRSLCPPFYHCFCFPKEDFLWHLVLSLYDDSPAFLACIFLLQSDRPLQLFMLMFHVVSGTQPVFYPTHFLAPMKAI